MSVSFANSVAIDRALAILSNALDEFIDSVATPTLPPGTDWRSLLSETDGGTLSRLRVLTEPFGDYGYVCEEHLTGAAMRLAGEIQRRMESGNDPDLAGIERLLRALGATNRAALVSELASEPGSPSPLSVAAIETEEATGAGTASESPLIQEPVVPERVDPDAVEITISATDVLSYAVAHNRIPVIRQLAIRNLKAPVQGAVLRIELRDAGGPIGAPKELLVDLEPESETVLNGIGFELDPAAMLQVEEQRPGKIQVELVAGDEVLAAASVQVKLLAANQWLASPLSLGLEMLAAFVMPNHPSITAMMNDVANRLLRTTGSDSIQGYQAGPERVDQIVAAIFAEMHARGIRYSEPPASWADTGQKVRTPGDVLDGRVGTCLDTVVVMAAALEQAGIRPLLWVVEGHAFLGYWREEHSLAAAAQTDAGDVVNLIDLGHVRLVETTMLTSTGPASMESAHQEPYGKYLSGHLEQVHGITDVYRARRDGILPLPARRRDETGNIVVTEYRPIDTAKSYQPPAAPVSVDRGAPSRSRAPIPPRVAQWKNRLLDLSLRNRLINFTDSARMSLTVPGDYLAAFEDAINQGTAFHLLPSDQIAAVHRERGLRYGRELPPEQQMELLVERKQVFIDLTESIYLSRLRALAYAARTLIEETGSNNLYLAFGSLLWSVDGKPLRSPLILVPVRLTAPSRGGIYRLTLDESGASTPNYCLLEKLRQQHGLEIPELQEPKEDGAGIDLQSALQSTREALAKRGLPFRVEPTADLAILQFAKFRLWKDLDEHWEAFSENSLVRHLIQTPNEPFLDPVQEIAAADLDQVAAVSPMPADSSQLAAVAEANAGRTFVLEGPPGTGKSQTITNLLTRAIAEGKRVLFVAEKRAALEVVRKRLDEVGVGEFCLDLHDKGSSTNEVRAQIRRALDHAVEVDSQGMETDLDLLSSARGSLVRYARRLHEKNPAGLSFYSARTQELAIGDSAPSLPVGEGFIAAATPELMTSIRGVLAALPDVADPAHPQPHHPWGFIDTGSPSSFNLDAVRGASVELDAALAELPAGGVLGDVLRSVRDAGDLATLYTLLNGSRLPLSTIDEAGTLAWQQASASVWTEIAAFGAASHPGLESVILEAFRLPLREIHDAAVAAEESGFFGRGKRIEAVRDQLAPVLRPGVDLGKHPSALTANLVQIQGEIQRLAVRVGAVRGIALPAGWNPLTEEGRNEVERQIGWLRWAGREVDLAGQETRAEFIQAMRQLCERAPAIDPSEIRALGRASATAQRFVAECGLVPGDLAGWSDSAGLIERWQQTSAGRRLQADGLPTLQSWLRLLQHLEPLRANHLPEARRALLRGEVEADEAVRAFDRGLAEASLRERQAATGLDGFDARNQMRTIDRFTRASTAVRDHLLTAIPDQVLRSRTFDVNASAGQVGQLHRQLSRQRGGMGVRALIANFGELITSIMPCVLVSPDSLSRFFAAKSGLFDIVVFDEASQIRVADAIGAMGRAKSVVVVGDSKQMPPTAFAEPSTTEDISDSALDLVEDEESILSECVQARVPQHWLSWHYRSQDESLIAFSNQQYYESKLSSFPSPSHGVVNSGAGGQGISLVRVDGQFHRTGKGAQLRTNPIEAEAVVAEIKRRFAASPDELPSIGVVTFNIQQRNLIEALLRDSGDPRLIEALDQATDGLFVKNLENVQGDERDTIFFSTAFSVNERGYLPLNFGPLNRGGGERRLNVAITRARRQVVVFSSFDPEQLRADETSSVGIKHLRAYLDVAAPGTAVLPHPARRRSAPDRHREEIAEALRERGYVVKTDVGLSEFKIDLSVAAVDDPDRQVMAVLLDGPQWASRRTVGDRDGLPTEVLSRMLRWPSVQRVWMPAWLADREAVLNELEAAFTMAVEQQKQPIAPPVPDPAVEIGAPVEDEPVSLADLGVADPEERETLASVASVVSPSPAIASTPAVAINGNEPFVPWTPRAIGTLEVLDALPSPRAAQLVRATLMEIIEAEGPVHVERLVRLTAASFGLGRVSEARNRSIVRFLDPDLRRDLGEPFAWPDRLEPATWTAYRPTPEGIDRPIEQISKREIVNAMAALCHASAGMSDEELRREALRVFGGRRMTANITAILDEAIVLGLESGRLKRSNSGLIVMS